MGGDCDEDAKLICKELAARIWLRESTAHCGTFRVCAVGHSDAVLKNGVKPVVAIMCQAKVFSIRLGRVSIDQEPNACACTSQCSVFRLLRRIIKDN